MIKEHTVEQIKTATDAASITVAVGTLAQILPSLAALFTIIWTGIRIYETQTVQRLLGRGDVASTDTARARISPDSRNDKSDPV